MKRVGWFWSLICFSLFSSAVVAQVKSPIKLPKAVADHYMYIPSGMAYFGEKNDSLEMKSFYISRTEIANFEYRIFLNDLLRKGKQTEYDKAVHDSTGWRVTKKHSMEGYVTHYHNHPSYADYPAVNMTYEGAVMYCAWVTDTLNKKYAGEFEFTVRLPARAEWVYAAQGSSKELYSWGTSYVRNKQGAFMANFHGLSQSRVSKDVETGEYTIMPYVKKNNTYINDYGLTAPVGSYYPNQFGLYNMNGNVAEMISSKGLAMGGSWLHTGYDIRNESQMEYTKPIALVGFRPLMEVKVLKK